MGLRWLCFWRRALALFVALDGRVKLIACLFWQLATPLESYEGVSVTSAGLK